VGEDLTFVFHSANIHYDLLRTGSVELTTNKILERGFLDAVRALLSAFIRPCSLIPSQPPEAYFTLYPHQSGADVVPRPAGTPTTARTTVTAQARPKDTLISRYGLEYRLPNADVVPSPQQDAGGRAVWEDTAEKREASLRERKAQMILAARQYVHSSRTSQRTDSLFVLQGEC
jgi:coupling of ubiquitin conjugation to ER degradation protein 1